MDNRIIDTIFLLGKPDDGRWVGIFVSSSQSEKVQKYGQIFVTISLRAPPEFDSKIAGDLLLENIQDQYHEEGKGKSVVSRLERVILSTAKRLEYLLQREKVAAEEGIDLNINIIVLKDDFVYMAVLGEGNIMLLRKGTLINLTSGLKDLTGRSLIKSGSGEFKEGDHFILLTPAATFTVSEKDIIELAKSFNFKNISKKKDDSLLGILLIKIGQKQKEKEQTTEIPIIKEVGEKKDEKQEERIESEDRKIMSEGKELLEKKGGGEKVIEEVEKVGKVPESPMASSDKEKTSQDKRRSLADLKAKIKDKLSDKTTFLVIFQKIKEFVVKIYRFAKIYIWEGFLGIGGKDIYIKGAGPKRSIRGVIILIFLVMCLLYLSIRTIQRQKDKKERVDQVQGVLSSIEEEFNNGRNLGEAGDIKSAVEVLEGALSKLEGAKKHAILLDRIEVKIEEGTDILYGIQKVILLLDSDIITDIAGYIEGASASDITLLADKIYIADASNGSIYVVGIEGGEVTKVAGQDLGLGSPDVIAFDSEGNLMISDLQEGILKLYSTEGRVDALAGLSSSSVGVVSEVDNYVDPRGNNFLYLLRGENNDVRKVSEFSSGYSFPELRIADSRFAGAKDIEIDGKIYILTQSEGVLRYFVGTFDPYTLVGLDKTIAGSNCLELDDFLVFFGDSANKRVAVVTKGSYLAKDQGKYVAQFVYKGDGDYLGDIREIVVDNEGRKIYILDGTKIFKADLSKVDEYAEELL